MLVREDHATRNSRTSFFTPLGISMRKHVLKKFVNKLFLLFANKLIKLFANKLIKLFANQQIKLFTNQLI